MFTLDEAKEAIKNKPEFRMNEREFGTVIDYMLTMPDTFKGSTDRETMILQNLRGTCFNKDGKIIRLAFHKFHNLNENPEYAASNFDFTEPHKIQVKLDGSMIAPIPFPDGSFKLGTRAGVTDVADKAQRLVDSFDDRTFLEYWGFMNSCISKNLTPIFEFCSREQRIVIDYAEPKLVLLDIRDNTTGEYVGFELLKKWTNIKQVETFASDKMNISEFAEVIRDLVGMEGVVVKFDDGKYVKIKGADYCMKHKALDGLRFEKDVLSLVLSGSLDDVLPLVDEDMKRRLTDYNKSVLMSIGNHQKKMLVEFEDCYRISADRAEFASYVKNSIYKTGLFALYSGKQFSLVSVAEKGTSSSSALEAVRWLIGKSFYDFQ